MGEFFEKIKENKILLTALIIIIVIVFITEGIVVYYLRYEISNKEEVIVQETKVEEQTYKVFVEIKGEVNTPGIYEIKNDKRVVDVIKLADGLTENADTRTINLSKKVIDEMVIIIYSKDQINDFLKVKEEEQVLSEHCNMDSITSANACLEIESVNTSLISINKATKEELMKLPGIGEVKANNIINYRNENGNFSNINDLIKVPGIGEAIYAQIKDFITTE